MGDHFDRGGQPRWDDLATWTRQALDLLQRGGQNGDLSALNAAVDLFRRVLAAAPDARLDRAAVLANLGMARWARFRLTGVLADLDGAVDACRQAVEATPNDHLDRLGRLANLGAALQTRYDWLRKPTDLDSALEASRAATAAIPVGHPARAGLLSNLGVTLRTRSERLGVLADPADLDEAVDVSRQAVDSTPIGHPDRPGLLSNLGLALRARFPRTRQLADLDDAIIVAREAVTTAPDHSPDRASYLANLGIALRARFLRTGTLADLDDAVEAFREAVEATPVGQLGRADQLTNLGAALRARFLRTGILADLDGAVNACLLAVRTADADHPARAAYLSNLGATLSTRFGQSGVPADLDDAVEVFRHAVAATPEDHPERVVMLTNLGASLRERFGRVRALFADVIIGTTAPAPADTDTDGLAGPNPWADVHEAVDVCRQAVEMTSAEDPERAGRLSNLGAALRARFRLTGAVADLDDAVEAGERAVAAVTADHPDSALYLANLGIARRTRFERTGAVADLERAIEDGRRGFGVAAASPRARARAAQVWGGAAAAGGRWATAVDGFAAAADLLEVLVPRELSRADREGLLAEVGGLGAHAAVCAVRAGDPGRAVELFEQGRGVLLGQALDVRQDLSPLRRADPESHDRFIALVTELDSPAAAGATWPAPVGDPVATADSPSGTADPADAGRPVSTERLAGTEEELVGGAPRRMRRSEVVLARRALRSELDRLVARIRTIPGFAGFLRPPPLSELTRAAAGGPVVLVAVSRFGSYALVVTEAGVGEPVELTTLTPDAVEEETARFLRALATAKEIEAGIDGRREAQQRLSRTLVWLWDRLAGPVLNHLDQHTLLPASKLPATELAAADSPEPGPGSGSGSAGSSSPPRLWWCLAGPLSFLPIHAAGRHDTRSDTRPETVIDRVVSSHTPSLRALAHTRRATGPTGPTGRGSTIAGSTDQPGGQVLAVVMPRTPAPTPAGGPGTDRPGADEAGAADDLVLSNALKELASLHRYLPGRVRELVGPDARWETVHTAITDATWVHFACHGHSDLTDPSSSRLLLHDHRERPLTVADISRLDLAAELAYLSACSTGQPGAQLVDEAIHLASAFQLAGYRHVLATLWPVKDVTASRIADQVYAALTGAEPVEPAVALHAAIRRLRDREQKFPSRWAAHFHSGI